MTFCIKCGCSENEDNAEFCHNCGTALDANYCTNPNCVMNNDDGTPNNPTHCFCNQCGSKNQYFEQGLIKPKNYNQE